ncbi:MAG: hypothetical protein KatS3mg034_2127 [Vicingaceae bacterium]|nr:MAG: hypothetical protein KatS3mg034_2127 [Vicingaceae bacterium]
MKNKPDASRILFKESQRFDQPWLWLLMAAIFSVNLFLLVKLGSTTVVLLSVAIFLMIVILFLLMKLETIVTTTGIYYRFLPFQINHRVIPYSSITEWSVNKYNPLKDFGGWGMRWSVKYKCWAYIVKGRYGINIVYDNGKKQIILGTCHPEELKQLIRTQGEK